MSLAAKPSQTGPLQYPLPGRVNFGWITEAWRLFAANAGAWLVAMLALAALPIAIVIVFYAFMLTSLVQGGFTTMPGSHYPPPGSVYPPGAYPPGAVPFSRTPGAPFPAPGLNALFAGGFGRIAPYELVAGLVMALYGTFFFGAMARMAVRQVRGLPLEVRDVFRGGPLFGRMLGATFPAFALMADGDGVFPALRRSVRGMKAQWLPATGFVFVLGLLVYASELLCGLGLPVTIPLVFLICALAYRDLVGMPNMVPPPAPDYGLPAAGVWPPPPGAAYYPPPGPQTDYPPPSAAPAPPPQAGAGAEPPAGPPP